MVTPPVPYPSTLDERMLLFINHMPHTLWTDTLALTLSGLGKAGLIWFLLSFWLFVREEKKDHRFFIPLVASGLSSWVLVELIIKPFVARLRPQESIGVWRVITEPESFSFPSAHATLAFALATVLAGYEPRFRWALYGFAVLISVSRVFLGVHYPSDVFAGALLGVGIGSVSLLLRKSPQKAKTPGRVSRGRPQKK